MTLARFYSMGKMRTGIRTAILTPALNTTSRGGPVMSESDSITPPRFVNLQRAEKSAE